MCRILLLADIRHMGIGFHAVVVSGLGKDFLSKSILGHCVESRQMSLNLLFLILKTRAVYGGGLKNL